MDVVEDHEQSVPIDRYGGEASVRALQSTVECVETIRKLLLDKIAFSMPNNVHISNSIVKQLTRLRGFLNTDGPAFDITRTLASTTFIELILTNVSTLLRYENVTDECLRVLAPLTRLCSHDKLSSGENKLPVTAETLQREVLSQMIRAGGIVFVLLALRGYMNSSLGVRLQGLDLLAALLEFSALSASAVSARSEAPVAVEEIGNTTTVSAAMPITSPSKRTTSPYRSSDSARYKDAHTGNLYGTLEAKEVLRCMVALPDNQLVQDVVHQMLLHGAGVVLVRLLQFSVVARSDISARRAAWCLRFLLLGTPPPLAQKIASYDQFACVRALVTQLRAVGSAAKLEIAVLLTGLLASTSEVAFALTRLGGWNDLSSVLACNAELVCIPAPWLSRTLQHIRLLGSEETLPMTGLDAPLHSVRSVPGKRNNGADDISAVETALLSKGVDTSLAEGSSFEDVLNSLLSKAQGSVRRAIRWSDSRPTSRGRPSTGGSERPFSRSQSQAAGVSLNKDSSAGMLLSNAASLPNFFNSVERLGTPAEVQSPTGNRSPGKVKHDIRKGKFAHGLMVNPLGEPVNPAVRRKLLRKHGGKMPMHIPHALGGPPMGPRPGPDYGSKMKKKDVQSSGLSRRNSSRPSSANAVASSSNALGPLANTADLLPTTEKGKRVVISAARQASFLAQKLFDRDSEELNKSDMQASTPNAVSQGDDSAIDKLNFAERLQCMIMQVQELT